MAYTDPMRFLLKLLVGGILLLVIAAFLGLLFLDRGAKAAVEHGVTASLGARTEVGSVSIRPFAGSVDIAGLRIANPEGFSDKPMLELGGAGLAVSLRSLASDEVEVSRLELSGAHLRLEGKGLRTNYGAVLERLKSGRGPDDSAPKPDAGSSGPGKRFVVRELVIRDTRVVADYSLHEALTKGGAASGELTIPELRLTEVAGGRSLSTGELAAEIYRLLLEAAASGMMPGLEFDISKDLKNLEGRAREIGKELEGALRDVKSVQDVKDLENLKGVQGIKDLLKKD